MLIENGQLKMRSDNFAVSFVNDPREPVPLMLVFSEDARSQVCIHMDRSTGERLLAALSKTFNDLPPWPLEEKKP